MLPKQFKLSRWLVGARNTVWDGDVKKFSMANVKSSVLTSLLICELQVCRFPFQQPTTFSWKPAQEYAWILGMLCSHVDLQTWYGANINHRVRAYVRK